MRRNPSALADRTFDLLVIGGGILGAGVARDAALRGLSVALIDKGDFASGTSSRSSKLIHGGFRYLEQGAFRLVAEACRERRILQDIAPHRVRPIPFLLPVCDGDFRSLAKMRLGMTLYDLLALFRNTARHRTLSPEEALEAEPALRCNGLRGAIRYYDCQEDDARFCVDHVLHAASLGAACANYCELKSFATTAGGRIESARATDLLTGESFDIRARAFVNAAGPWVANVAGLVPPVPGGRTLAIGPTKGVHLLLPQLTRGHAIAFQARRDGRIMFVLPWHDCSLVGTTDTDYRGDPDDVRAEPADVDYLLDAARSILPDARITSSDVITTFAGLRPLLRSDAGQPSARSREHELIRQGENFLTLAGGKYTTFRTIAENAVDAAYKMLGRKPARCRTATTPLPDARPPRAGERLSDAPEVFASDVVHAVENEMAQTVGDVMDRRVGLGVSRWGTPAVAARVAAAMIAARPDERGRIEASLADYTSAWLDSRALTAVRD